jgi:hypothetical protein
MQDVRLRLRRWTLLLARGFTLNLLGDALLNIRRHLRVVLHFAQYVLLLGLLFLS